LESTLKNVSFPKPKDFYMFKKVAVAIAFSPYMEALIAETFRLKNLFDAEWLLIHVGEKNEERDHYLHDLLYKLGVSRGEVDVFWEQGKPAKKIIQVCEEQQVDLLVTGALKQEGFLQYYLGSIARKIIRKAKCSVLTLIEPMVLPEPFERVVINGTQLDQTPYVIQRGIEWCKLDQTKHVYIVNEIKMFGLQMATAGEGGEQEISSTRRKLVAEEMRYVEDILKTIDQGNLRVNIKITGGKWAVELAKFAIDIKADLLIVGDKGNLGIFDRIFPHDLEDILSNLPCNLLIIKNK
jgi:nucleotide-binding universal stress UspA family protein